MREERAADIVATLPQRISDVIEPWVACSPDRPALVESGGAWTYGQLASRVVETQTWLVESGVRPGDRVLIICENCRGFVSILLAAAALGAWPVLVNARLSGPEVDQIRDHCGARRTIYTVAASPQAMRHAKRHGAVIEEKAGLGLIGLGPLNEEVDPEPDETEVAHRVAALIYTSGTTGVPKGVMLTHRNLLFVAAVSASIRSLSASDRMYGVLPMSHAVGLSVVLLGTLLSGGTVYLAPRFDPAAVLSCLAKDQLTVLLGSPSMFSVLLDYLEWKGMTSVTAPALRIISSSGAPLQPAVKSSVERVLGLPLHNGYGVTECSPNIAQMRPDHPRTDVSVGQILPGVETQLIGGDGNPVAEGHVGELRVRGPNVMRGYYKAPEETAAAIDSDGWFNTRDLARIDDGHLFIVGRTKELIVRFGFNVYPAEVEAVLNAHPAVARSAVIGQAAAGIEGGEKVIAFVQPVAGTSLGVSDLTDHAARHLAPYKRPSEIHLVAALPLTLTGKVKKEELAALQPGC